MNGNSAVDLNKLRELYKKPAARAMLDEFATRERNRTETKVENLHNLTVDDRPIKPNAIVQVFKELEKIGCGSFVVGRRGGASRFRWVVGLVGVGKAAAGEDLTIEFISPVDAKEEPADAPEGEKRKSYAFPLRPNLDLRLDLPLDLSPTEAARLSDFIKSLPFDRNPQQMKSV